MNSPPSQYTMPGRQPHPTSFSVQAYGQAHTTNQFASSRPPSYGPPAPPQYSNQPQCHRPPPSPTGFSPQMHTCPYMPPLHTTPHSSPTITTPPTHWGFDRSGASPSFPPPQGYPPGPPHAQRMLHDRGGFGQQRNFGGVDRRSQNRSNKRPHSTAFSQRPAENQPTAPLPIPIFGNPLPSKPPPAIDATRKAKKKRRKYNQLGLTPRTEDHESSEEDDDINEELRLAMLMKGSELKVTYRGRTATLQSAADITAWLQDRRQRYPTAARIAEKAKESKERKAAREARKAGLGGIAKRHREEITNKEIAKVKEKLSCEQNLVEAAEKAKLKAEKLRKKLLKEEERIAKAEAAAERARQNVESLKVNNELSAYEPMEATIAAGQAEGDPVASVSHNNETNINGTVGQGLEQETPTTQGAMDGEMSSRMDRIQGAQVRQDNNNHVSLDTIGDLNDETSSSGSDSSTDDSDDTGESESGPELMTSKRQRPDRVPPSARRSNNTCHQLLKTGTCRREHCQYKHEIAAGEKNTAGGGERERQSLMQALMARQREDEDQRVMEAISKLGEQGLLNDDA
ncbi:hypothetical protein LOZ58_002612 [Ophidiomyces ophidiicola]|nr:hypothetical protein LOZ58_002612 [Ophidiomyces ophidiicola]